MEPEQTAPPKVDSDHRRFHDDDVVLTEREAIEMFGICRTTLFRLHKAGLGPRRIQLSQRRVGYRLGDCRAWQLARIR